MTSDFIVICALLLLIFFQFCVILKLNNRGNKQVNDLFGSVYQVMQDSKSTVQEMQTVAHSQQELLVKMIEHASANRV